jgi:hypothetical protein
LAHAGKFFPTIAVQLTKQIPSLEGHICESLEKHDDVSQLALHDQWRNLIYTPLSRLENSFRQSRLLIIIDALDECEGDNDIRALLKLLSEIRDITTVRLRVFITSRPETPLPLGFCQMPSILHHDLVLDYVPRELVNQDILIFFKHQFSEIRYILRTLLLTGQVLRDLAFSWKNLADYSSMQQQYVALSKAMTSGRPTTYSEFLFQMMQPNNPESANEKFLRLPHSQNSIRYTLKSWTTP